MLNKFLTAFVCTLITTICSAANYPVTNLNKLTGFAQQAHVTGGSGGKVVIVKDISTLKNELLGSEKKTIVIEGQIGSNSKQILVFGSNKTIVGSFNNLNVLNNIYLVSSANSSNVIFQNLIFKHDPKIRGNGDIQLYIASGNKYWIDHCSFVGHKWSVNDGSLDKLIHVGESADYITISHSLFANHKYGSIFGYSMEGYNSKYNGYPRMTLSNNYYNNIDVRSPGLMRYGYYHSYNNYISNYHLGYTLAQNARLLSEANYFESGYEKGIVDDKKENTSFTDVNSYPSSISSYSRPASWKVPYSYRTQTASFAKNWDMNYSGAQASSGKFVYPY